MTSAAARSDAHEVITMGSVGVDLYPLQVGLGLADVERFGRYLGGSPTNVTVAAASHGRRAAFITRTGDDPFGAFGAIVASEIACSAAMPTAAQATALLEETAGA